MEPSFATQAAESAGGKDAASDIKAVASASIFLLIDAVNNSSCAPVKRFTVVLDFVVFTDSDFTPASLPGLLTNDAASGLTFALPSKSIFTLDTSSCATSTAILFPSGSLAFPTSPTFLFLPFLPLSSSTTLPRLTTSLITDEVS